MDKYNFEKNKKKYLLIGSIALSTLLVAGGIYLFTTKNGGLIDDDNKVVVEDMYRKADYIFIGDERGIVSLVSTDKENKVKTLDFEAKENILYSRDNNLESIMVYNNGVFYELFEENGEIKNTEAYKLEKAEVIKSFIFSKKYIAYETNDKVIVINRNNKEKSEINEKDIKSMILSEDDLIYAVNSNIALYNIISKNSSKIDVGNVTDEIYEIGGKLVVFNKFGVDNNTYTIMELEPTSLYIDYAYGNNNSNTYGVATDTDDNLIVYSEKSSKNNIDKHSLITMDREDRNRKKVDLPTLEKDEVYNDDKCLYTKGYLYILKNETVEIMDIRGEVIDTEVDITNSTFFMPILK